MLIDTSVLIGALRSDPLAIRFLESQWRSDSAPRMSVVTITEIIGGMRSHERQVTRRFFDSLEPEPVTEEIARLAGQFNRQYRRSHHNIGVADYLIAATASVRELPLATLNVKHFPMFPGLKPAWEVVG